MEEKEFLDKVEDLFRAKLNSEFEKFELAFFKRLNRKPNWSLDQIREEWLLALNDLEKDRKRLETKNKK